MIQLRYDMMTAALDCGIPDHPQRKMIDLGYEIIHAVPQSIADQWWFTVDKIIDPLPPYLEKMEYNIDDYK